MATGELTVQDKTVFKLRCSCYGHEQDVRAVAPVPFPEGAFVSGSRDRTARVWVPNDTDVGFMEQLTTGGHTNFISAVCVLPPDDMYPQGVILTGSHDHDILAYTITSPEPIYKLSGHTNTVCSLAVGKMGTVISGSWDNTAKVWHKHNCAMTLEGHQQAVWCVLMMPEKGYMLSGSADKTIKMWRAGKCERTFEGHADCVRGLAVLSAESFLSCSNDATVRQWSVSGECIGALYGHTNYIYSIAVFANGRDFVTCGEDRMLKVWENGKCVQTIPHPAQSIWAVTILSSGDVVTGASDGILRVFTSDPVKFADPQEQANFADSVSKSVIPAQIGDINTSDLVGPDALEQPGQKDGQTLMIRRGDAIEAHQWSEGEGIWVKIGDVVGGSGGTQASSGKVLYEGKEYDYVFDVELTDGVPLKLPYNTGQDPWFAAQEFIHKNELSQMFLDQVANFIQQNTQGVTLGPAAPSGYADPFTGGSRYVPVGGASSGGGGGASGGVNQGDPLTGGNRYIPGSVPGGTSVQPMSVGNSYFPETSYIKYDQLNIHGVFTKLKEFNGQMSDDKKLSDGEVDQLELIVSGKVEPTSELLPVIWKTLSWPQNFLFPALDILRHLLTKASPNNLLCSGDSGSRLLEYALNLLKTDSTPNNQRLILRALCNVFLHGDGAALISTADEALCGAVLKMNHPTEKHTQIALSSLFLNLIISFCRARDQDALTRMLLSVAELSQTQTDTEAHFRILVAVGTAIHTEPSLKEFASALNLSNFVRVCKVCEENDKVKGCASHLEFLIN